jgi:hypothetical protein
MDFKQMLEKIRSWTRRSALLSAADFALSRLRSTERSQPSWWFVRDGVTPELLLLVATKRSRKRAYSRVFCTRYVYVYMYMYQDVGAD